MPKRFISATPWAQLAHLPRYLKAGSLRLEKLRADPARDAHLAAAPEALLTEISAEDLETAIRTLREIRLTLDHLPDR